MAHMIDMSNARSNIAYRGDTPWHGLGFRIEQGDTPEQIAEKAGLQWRAMKAPVQYQNGEMHTFAGRNVLFRSDTGAALSVVADGYNEVQPDEIIGFFRKLVEVGGFEIEVAGALSGGKRIWCLAKVNDGADIVAGDRVRPYILLATSYDGTMATIGKFTAIRVVCNNTISMAIPQFDAASGYARGGEAGDTETGKGRNVVRVLHSQKFDADEMRKQLGIALSAWERFQWQAGVLAQYPMAVEQADEFILALLTPLAAEDKRTPDIVRESRGYGKVMLMFQGAAAGADMAGQTRWGMLNAVTQFVDHERGRSDNSRLESAWFGAGNALKDRAMELLSA